eukprot:14803418-Ditylum_brightwellii.AAC.1
MTTFYKPSIANEPQSNSPQKLKPIIMIEQPKVQKLAKGEYHMYKLCMVSYNINSPKYNLAIPFYNTGSVEE